MAERDSLRVQLASSKAVKGDDTAPAASVPRPAGTAGQDFNIQQAMGLAGSEKSDKMYHALQVRIYLVMFIISCYLPLFLKRRIKDFMGYSRIEYNLTWKDIPVKTKSTFFEAVSFFLSTH